MQRRDLALPRSTPGRRGQDPRASGPLAVGAASGAGPAPGTRSAPSRPQARNLPPAGFRLEPCPRPRMLTAPGAKAHRLGLVKFTILNGMSALFLAVIETLPSFDWNTVEAPMVEATEFFGFTFQLRRIGF